MAGSLRCQGCDGTGWDGEGASRIVCPECGGAGHHGHRCGVSLGAHGHCEAPLGHAGAHRAKIKDAGFLGALLRDKRASTTLPASTDRDVAESSAGA